MAFLKVDEKKSGTYLRVLESYRDSEGKVRHNNLFSLGKVEDYTPEQLRRIGLRLYELGGGEIKSALSGPLEEISRHNYGYCQVFGKVFEKYGLDVILKHIGIKHKLSFDLVNAVKLMLMERLHDPSSKRSNFINQEEYIGIAPVKIQHLYRALDKLADYNEVVQRRIFQTGRGLFDQQLDVVFYDVTTLYFDSELEQEGHLPQKGFGKDGKIGKTQILFCMLIDRDKQPIGYRVFKGDTYEGHTFIDAISALKKQYSIDKVIIVADRGMLSKDNIQAVKESDYEFIVGERLKKLPGDIQKDLLDISKYTSEWIYNDNENKEVKIKYCTATYEGRIIIATFSQKRADKDKHQREQKIEKAKKLLQNPSLLKKKAGIYFIKQEGKDQYSMDEEKIKQNEKYDGFLAIATNNQTLAITEVLEQYKQLYKIEQTFRSFKSHLETRPMFHWADKRIEGHICLCYIAFTMLNNVILTLEKQKMHISEDILRKMLDKMQVSLLRNGDQEMYIRSAQQPNEANLQTRLSVKPLPPVFPMQDINKYL